MENICKKKNTCESMDEMQKSLRPHMHGSKSPCEKKKLKNKRYNMVENKQKYTSKYKSKYISKIPIIMLLLKQ